MDDFLKEAIDITKAQASVRVLTEDEIATMIEKLYRSLQEFSGEAKGLAKATDMNPKDAIKERSITCLECGKGMKLLTAKHLLSHGLTPKEYREKYGYKENAPLVCKSLQRTRKNKMKEIRLWERKIPSNT